MQREVLWTITTHEHKEHTPDWYWGLGVLTLAGIGVSVYISNFLLAVILLVGGASLGALVARGPREHVVRLDKRGISLDGTLYPYRTVYSFWVEEEQGPPRLFLSMKGLLASHVTIPLDNHEHAQSVREHLLQFAEEIEQSPRFGEHLAEMLGL